MGVIGTWFYTATHVIKQPYHFFSNSLDEDRGPYMSPLMFSAISFVVYGLFLGLGIAVWSLATLGTVSMEAMLVLVLAPTLGVVGGLVGVLVLAAIIHVFVYLLGGRGFTKTMAAVLYATAVTAFFGWIPFVNMLAGLYIYYIVARGLQTYHRISFGRALIAVAIFPVLLLISIGLLSGSVLIQMGAFDQCMTTQPRFAGQAVTLDTWAWTGTDSMALSLIAVRTDVQITEVAFDWDDDGAFEDTIAIDPPVDISAGSAQSVSVSGLSTTSGECARGTIRFTYDADGVEGRQTVGSGKIGGPVP